MMPMTVDADMEIVPVGAEVVPGHRVEALLSRGGRVDTYDVTSIERDCRAVVKVVRPDRLDEEPVRAALLTEGALLTTLTHPHLVRGYEVVTGPRPAVVLETLPGATLAAIVDDGRLGVADIALLGRQVVSVLGYLHRQGWLHLDVKPDNIVVQEGRAVLIDLGLASRPGRVERSLGTDGYAAPEQDAGGTVSEATDVWGLAATLFECATGDAPGRSPDLSRVPTLLRPVLASCLLPEPMRRPPIVELGDRLDDVLAEPQRLRWTSWPLRSAGRPRGPRRRAGRAPSAR
jgi:serine/threonine protein kinase